MYLCSVCGVGFTSMHIIIIMPPCQCCSRRMDVSLARRHGRCGIYEWHHCSGRLDHCIPLCECNHSPATQFRINAMNLPACLCPKHASIPCTNHIISPRLTLRAFCVQVMYEPGPSVTASDLSGEHCTALSFSLSAHLVIVRRYIYKPTPTYLSMLSMYHCEYFLNVSSLFLSLSLSLSLALTAWWVRAGVNMTAIILQAQAAKFVVVCLGEETYTEKPGDINDLNLAQGQIEVNEQYLSDHSLMLSS